MNKDIEKYTIDHNSSIFKGLETIDKNNKKIKTTRFGAKGYSDFTKHRSESRKKSYILRHKKNENWNDYMSAGSLSRYILWGETTLKKSIEEYKKRFKLE